MKQKLAKDQMRITLRLDDQTAQRVSYYAQQDEISVNAFIIEAIALKIAHRNGDYDVPTLMMQRFSQLVEQITALREDVKNSEIATLSALEGLIEVTRGDSTYLQDD